jgi:hypothetical protein
VTVGFEMTSQPVYQTRTVIYSEEMTVGRTTGNVSCNEPGLVGMLPQRGNLLAVDPRICRVVHRGYVRDASVGDHGLPFGTERPIALSSGAPNPNIAQRFTTIRNTPYQAPEGNRRC